RLEQDLQEIKEAHHNIAALLADPSKVVPPDLPANLMEALKGYLAEDRMKIEGELAKGPNYSGEKAFKLYDTFGMPLDFIKDAARDQGIGFDQAGFDAAMEEQKQRARASWKGAAKQTANPEYQKLPASDFEGYHRTRSDSAEVLALLKDGHGVQELKPGEQGEAILDHTPFYAEAGGPVGDRGWFYADDHNTAVAEVTGTYYPVQGVRAHKITIKSPPNENRVGWGNLKVGDKVDAVVNADVRLATMRNHTATHLLHAGLRE